ncbi:WD40 repeat domain-containing protein [Streptomyces sp. NPDC049541]|uniref:WD40 repeat domain-containing protein n=1 Tax=Streptomyces sp. NPDC049541 TaxID=3365594 RepID=UPI0037B35108
MSTGPDITRWPPPDGVTAAHGPALLEWAACAPPEKSRLCLVRGARGRGKSQLLAWFLAGSASHPSTTVHATLLAEGLFADAVAWELGRQLGYGPLAPERLLERLAVDQRPLFVLVVDLHRSGRGPADRPAADPAALVRDLLAPLLELPQTRAVVEVGDTAFLDGLTGAGIVTTIDVGDEPFKDAGATAAATAEDDSLLPRTPEGRVQWDKASGTAREHALDRALTAPEPEPAIVGLVSDPGFLVHGSTVSLAACLADERIPAPRGLRQTWKLAAPHLSNAQYETAERAAVLHAAALESSPLLARYLSPLLADHAWAAVWARQDTAVSALAAVPGKPGTILAADPLGSLFELDAGTGTYRVSVPRTAAGVPRLDGMAAFGEHGALLLSDTGALHSVGEEPGGVLGRIAAHHGRAGLAHADLRPSALGHSPCGKVVVLGDEQGSVHVWSLEAGEAAPLSRVLHSAPVTAVTCLVLSGDGQTLVMSTAMDGTVRLWKTSADPMPRPVEQRPALATAMTVQQTSVGPLLAVAWNDASLHLWHLPSGRVRALPLLLPCSSLACTPAPAVADQPALSDSRLCLTIGGSEGSYALSLDAERLWSQSPPAA